MLSRIIVLSLLLFLAGCSLLAHEAPIEDIEKASALFFQRFENNDYDAIYNDASKRFKQNKTKQEVTDNLKQIREIGMFGDYNRISTSTQGEGKDRVMLPVFAVFFDKGKGDLTLMFVDEDAEWKLIGFEFKPRL